MQTLFLNFFFSSESFEIPCKTHVFPYQLWRLNRICSVIYQKKKSPIIGYEPKLDFFTFKPSEFTSG